MTERRFTFLITEYEKLKDEQHKRVEFRDQMIYITLGAIGAVFSYALQKPEAEIALLVLPFVCLIMGWTYLTNDYKISQMGAYIRKKLIPEILKDPNLTEDTQINWEIFNRTHNRRKRHKLLQLVVDITIFGISGVVSVMTFIVLHSELNFYHLILISLEFLALFYLIFLYISYTEF